MKSRINRLAMLLIALTFGTSLQAAVITFEELPHEQELQGGGDLILTKGFALQYAPAVDEPYPVGFQIVGSSWAFNGRSTALAANSCSATTTLRSQDNNPITLLSIDLAELNGDTDVSVLFEGTTLEGAVVRKSVDLKDRRIWQTVLFPASFKNLQYVQWSQGDCIINKPHMFDNIRVHQTRKEMSLD